MSRRVMDVRGLDDVSGLFTDPSDMLHNAISLVFDRLAVHGPVAKVGSLAYLVMHRDLPYIIHETSIPGVRCLVNRYYKPLGCNRRGSLPPDWVRYEDYKQHLVPFTDKQLREVCRDMSPTGP